MPRYIANPTPEQSLAALLASSGCSSLLDVRFARWLDSNDTLGYMRFLFHIPTSESMQRQAPQAERPMSAEDIVAQNQRERAARQANRRRSSSPNAPGKSVSPASGKDNGRQGGDTSRAGVLDGSKESFASKTKTEDTGSASESEDGYASDASSTTSAADRRSPSRVRRDVLSEAHGTSDPLARRSSDNAPGGQATSSSQNGNVGFVATKQDSGSKDARLPTQSFSRPEGNESIVYLAGNSLGLQSKGSLQAVQEEMSMWQTKAVTGWFNSHYGRPWKSYSEDVSALMAGLAGCEKSEVAVMGTLTANMHLLLCSFYRPTKERYKILFESKAFPSDNYAFASQAEMHGYDKKDALVRVGPRPGEYNVRIEDILEAIEREGDQVAVVFFSGVNYFTGQVFDMQRITEAAHKKGCLVGWDLAHAIGNIPLDLHKWDVDFAAWCTYKYLNSGPGGIGGLYVHEKHSSRPRLSGWWGNNLKTRFNMAEDFDPAPGAAGFQTSTPSILALAALLGSLENYMLCGKEESSQQEAPASSRVALLRLRKKSLILTAYLNCLLKSSKGYVPLDQVEQHEKLVGDSWKNPEAKQFRPGFTIITPERAEERGCQISVLLLPRNIGMLKHTNHNLEEAGVFGDEREPDVIRFSPVPLYNTFKECFMAFKTFEWALKTAAVQIQGRPRGKKGAGRKATNATQ